MMALRAAAEAARGARARAADPRRRAGGRERARLGTVHGRHRAVACARTARRVAAPALLLSGGETTVTIGGGPAGRGGRNTEFLLGLAVALAGAPGIWALAGDTDGIDGTEDAAGAHRRRPTRWRAPARTGSMPRAMLAGHDSYTLFAALGDLIVTGPTLTNVNDYPRHPDRLTPEKRR